MNLRGLKMNHIKLKLRLGPRVWSDKRRTTLKEPTATEGAVG